MFSNRVDLKTSPNELARIVKRHKACGRTVLDLTETNPTKIGLTYEKGEILAALSRPEGLRYEPDPCGILPAREAICGYYREIGDNVDPGAVYLTSSTSEAYAAVFKLLGDPGDEILIPCPGYPLLNYLARFESLLGIFYPKRYAPERGWYLDFDAIEARITPKTRAIVVVSPNNPTGAYLKDREIIALDRICCRHDMALIVDEVFWDYNDTCSFQPVQSAVNRCKTLTFVLNGFSKMVALPQVKLGWIVVSGEKKQLGIAKKRLEMLLDFYLSVSAQSQYAVGGLLALRHAIQGQIKNRIAFNQKELNRNLAETENCRMLLREGGWYAVVEIDDQWEDDARVATLLSEDRTLVHPGYFYDFHREGFIVISLLTQVDLFKQGIRALVKRFGHR